MYLDNVRFTNFETALDLDGGSAIINNSVFDNNGTGIKAPDGSNLITNNTRFQNQRNSDIVYGDQVQIQLLDTYAEQLFNITEGSYEPIDAELNHIAYKIIDTSDPTTIARCLEELSSIYSSTPPWLRGGIKFEILRELVTLGVDLL